MQETNGDNKKSFLSLHGPTILFSTPYNFCRKKRNIVTEINSFFNVLICSYLDRTNLETQPATKKNQICNSLFLLYFCYTF
jgi:hypothetical protein